MRRTYTEKYLKRRLKLTNVKLFGKKENKFRKFQISTNLLYKFICKIDGYVRNTNEIRQVNLTVALNLKNEY